MNIARMLLITVSILLGHNSYALKAQHWTTPNGVRVVFYQAMEVPMLDVSMAFAAGGAYDGNQFGLSALTTNLLNQGNAGMNTTQIADAFANNGSQFSANNSRDMVVLSLRTLNTKNALEQSSKTLSQIVSHPDFTDEAFNQEKMQQLMDIEQTKESPETIAQLKLFKTIYFNHPYAHPIDGTAKTVKAITKDQVIHFYKKYFVGQNAILVLVGAVDEKTARSLADTITQDLPKGTMAQPIPKAPQIQQAAQTHITYPSSQTIISMGQTGIDNNHPDYFPLMVGNYILGGNSIVSRLGTEVREHRGLTYGVTSQFIPMPGVGPFIINLSTQHKKTAEALKITQETLKAFIHNGPTPEELLAAKQYLTGSFPLTLSSNRDIATLLLRMSFYQLPEDYFDTYTQRIQNVRNEDIVRAFQGTVNPNKMSLITVGRL
jgi:zinc protease